MSKLSDEQSTKGRKLKPIPGKRLGGIHTITEQQEKVEQAYPQWNHCRKIKGTNPGTDTEWLPNAVCVNSI